MPYLEVPARVGVLDHRAIVRIDDGVERIHRVVVLCERQRVHLKPSRIHVDDPVIPHIPMNVTVRDRGSRSAGRKHNL